MANIEVKKFADMVSAIGADTLAAIATAGPDMQVIDVLLNRNENTGFDIEYNSRAIQIIKNLLVSWFIIVWKGHKEKNYDNLSVSYQNISVTYNLVVASQHMYCRFSGSLRALT